MAGPGSDEAIVTDVFPALTAGGPEESHVPPGSFFVTVQADAGSDAFGNGEAWRLHMLVKDLVSGTNVINSILSGSLNSPSWPAHNHTFTFVATAAPNTFYQATAVLLKGIAEPSVSFLESDPIVVS